MGTIIERNVVSRRKGFMYYVDGKGNVVEAKMRTGGKKGRSVCRKAKKKKKK